MNKDLCGAAREASVVAGVLVRAAAAAILIHSFRSSDALYSATNDQGRAMLSLPRRRIAFPPCGSTPPRFRVRGNYSPTPHELLSIIQPLNEDLSQ